jgi:uncharacterized protein YceH (UPF0502 family)
MPLPVLSLLETRVIGVLVEKQHTVPDTYPLTLNALVAGCNQKTARDPVIEATDAEVQAAVDHLRQLSLVVESSGGRVMRYSHNLARVLGVPTESAALVATLMLRGPQTSGELRINAERMHRFADISSVEAYLAELAQRALVVELPRAAGAREPRWAHRLAGAPPSPAPSVGTDLAPSPVASGEIAAMKHNLDALGREVAELRALVERLMTELGVRR